MVAARPVLAIVLIVSAIAKLLAPMEGAALSVPLARAFAALELAFAVLLLLLRGRRFVVVVVTWAICVICAGGLLIAWGSQRPCGCLGRWVPITRTGHIAMCVLIGWLACIELASPRNSKRK